MMHIICIIQDDIRQILEFCGEWVSIYAVITGDIIGSSGLNKEDRERTISSLKIAFNLISDDVIAAPFQIFRGDSFQGVISRPEESLAIALLFRSTLLSLFDEKHSQVDCRIAIGIGQIERLNRDYVGEGDGQAFRFSGRELDKMKSDLKNLSVITPWMDVNDELDAETSLVDALINRWTKEQAEISKYYILNNITINPVAVKEMIGKDIRYRGLIFDEDNERWLRDLNKPGFFNQYVIADILKKSQSSISRRVYHSGYRAIEKLLYRYNHIISDWRNYQ